MSDNTIYFILGVIVILAICLPFIASSFNENKHRIPKPPKINIRRNFE